MNALPPPMPNGSIDRPANHDQDVLAMFLARKMTRSSRTAFLYGRELARFRTAVQKPLAAVTLGDLLEYVEARREAGAAAPASQALVITTLRSFFRFGQTLGYLTLNPAELLETPRTTSMLDLRWCNAQEIGTLIRAAERINPIAALLCPFLALTGMRIAEAASVRWSSFVVDPHRNIGVRIIGKGRKGRTIKIRDDLWQMILADRRARNLPAELDGSDAPLFPNRWGNPCSVRYLRHAVAAAVKQSGIKKSVSPHWLRHSNATLALAGGASLLRVQRDLGHGSIAVTERYLHLAEGLKEGSADFVRISLTDSDDSADETV